MAKDNFDNRQKEAIECIDNVVVSAGAGSGKTSVLSARFVHLVTKVGYKVDQILTLTFTKKAAVEMKGRIFQKLRDASEKAETAEERNRALEAVKNFDKAFIGTLDSYCSDVARQGAHFYGISPDFTADTGGYTDKIYTKAFQFALENRNHPGIKYLIDTLGVVKVANDFFAYPMVKYSLVVKPLEFFKDLETQRDFVIEDWNKKAGIFNNAVTNIKKFLNEEDCGKGLTGDNIRSVVTTAQCTMPEISVETFEQKDKKLLFEDLKNCLPVGKLSKRGSTSKAHGIQLIMAEIDRIQKVFSNFGTHYNFILNYENLKSTADLMNQFQNQINEEKRISGSFTFDDISYLALKTLLEHPEIRRQEKEKFKAIMIDEFQDDNKLQCDLLFLLAEKNGVEDSEIATFQNMKDKLEPQKLFFVGDEKQSIYRFRGADVSVFRNLKDNIQKNINLETNYRSDPELIEFFNTTFGGEQYPIENVEAEKKELDSIMPVHGKAVDTPAYAAEYEKVQVPEFKQKKITDTKVKVGFYLEDKDSEFAEMSSHLQEAYWTVQQIKHIVENETRKNDKGEDVKYEYSDFAVLFKSVTHLREYQQIFMANGIPYATDALKGIFNDGPTNDLYSFLTLCAYPQDKMCYAKLLTSPLVNLTVPSMEAVIALGNEPFAEDSATVLSGCEKKNFLMAGRFFKEIQLSSKTEKLTTSITRIWHHLGYKYETQWNSKVQMFQCFYDILFEFARQAEEASMNLASFVDELKYYQGETTKLESIDVPFENVSGVQFMTIHGSKGLQFPVVFVCGITNKPKAEQNEGGVYVSDEYGITYNIPLDDNIKTLFGDKAKANYFYEQAKVTTKAELQAELCRLTYVAYTRAVNKLFITGSYSGEIKVAQACQRIVDIMGPVFKQHLHTVENEETDGKLDYVANADSPFSFEEFPGVLRKEAFEYQNKEDLPNNFEGKLDFIAKKEQEFAKAVENALVIQKEKVLTKYVNPSGLEEKRINLDGEDNTYLELNKVVENSPNERFGFNDFGTIAHKFIECKINQVPVEIEEKFLAALDNNIDAIKVVKSAAEKMAEGFIESDLGKEALEARTKGLLCKAEYDFRSYISGLQVEGFAQQQKILVKGQMDLIYKNTDISEYEYTIVDYKTDKLIEPEMYFKQVSSYRQAASAMLCIPEEKIRCVLFYLRHKEVVDVTENCSDEILKTKIESVISV